MSPDGSEEQRVLFIRTFKHLKGGGPIPPLGALYLSSVIERYFGGKYRTAIFDTGLMTSDQCLSQMEVFRPHIVGLSVLSCEDQVMRLLAGEVKRRIPDAKTIVGGPHAVVAAETLLEDPHIDFVVMGEAEQTIVELLESLAQGEDPVEVDGVACRQDGVRVKAKPRRLKDDLDVIPFPAWEKVDLAAYARQPNWNGTMKERLYAPLMTSRGCPYGCFFCHNIFGKKVRTRSPENVFSEVMYVHEQFGVSEFHVVDDLFNFDAERAKQICCLVMDSGIRFSFAFPNGMRADIMTEDLIQYLRRAGTYKINYGFETTSPRLQKLIGKNLDIEKAARTIKMTAQAGIITGAYFMLGFPTQTRAEMMETVEFAARSPLDVAYFFKATPYPGSRFHQETEGEGVLRERVNFGEYHFYSVSRSYGDVGPDELNRLILLAQQRFYLRFGRFWRGLWKSPRKLDYMKKLLSVIALLIQSHLFSALAESLRKGEP